jgi:aminoglycoside 6'-N-acetyltransferase I
MIEISRCVSVDQSGWLELRQALWPQAGEIHRAEMAAQIAVPFLEGLYVAPQARRKGVATALVDAVSAWAKAAGYRELASDARLENEASHAMHRALGFAETQRVVYFRKEL